MGLFVDTSALVKYYYPERDSRKVERAILEADRVYVSELSLVEFASALVKKVRMGDLGGHERSLAWDAFLVDLGSESVAVISLSEDDYRRASQLIIDHAERRNLRTLDSLQLVAAMKVPAAGFMAADRELTKMAKSLGLRVEGL